MGTIKTKIVNTAPLTQDEMWKLLQSLRAFESDPGGVNDKLRKQPATILFDPKGKGPQIGPGYQTFAVIQAISPDRRTIIISYGYFSGGSDSHGEEKCIRALESEIAKQMPGGKMTGGQLIGLVDQDVCPRCQPQLRAFAERQGMAGVKVYVPERPDLRFKNFTRMATPKGSMRSSLGVLFDRSGRPVTVTFRESFAFQLAVPKISLSPKLARIRVVGRYAGKSVGMAALGLLFGWLRGRLDQQIVERQIQYLGPKIEEEVQRQKQKVLDLVNQGKKAYVNVTVDIETRITKEDGFEFADFPTVELKTIDVTDRNINDEGRPRTHWIFPLKIQTITFTFSIEINI